MGEHAGLSRSFVHRIAGARPIGVGVASTLLLLALGVLPLLWVDASEMPDGWIVSNLLRSLLSGYTLAASALVVRGAAHDLADLRPVATSPGALERLVAELAWFPARGLLLSRVVALLLMLVLPWSALRMLQAAGWPAAAVVWAADLIFVLILIPVLYMGVVLVQRFIAFGTHDTRVDLLGLDTLQPFGRIGLRIALSVLGTTPVVFGAQALVGFQADQLVISVTLLVPFLLLGAFALLAPSRGIHRRIQQAKQAELALVRTALAGDRAAMATSQLGEEATALSRFELLLYRDRIAGLREWPLDASALRRFGLYLLIPLGSWVGSALMERAVERVIE